MYFISLTPENRVLNVYNENVWLDEGVVVYALREEDFQAIWASGKNGDWVYNNDAQRIVYDPEPIPVKSANAPSGEIPQQVL
jgi:hypothetical protein